MIIERIQCCFGFWRSFHGLWEMQHLWIICKCHFDQILNIIRYNTFESNLPNATDQQSLFCSPSAGSIFATGMSFWRGSHTFTLPEMSWSLQNITTRRRSVLYNDNLIKNHSFIILIIFLLQVSLIIYVVVIKETLPGHVILWLEFFLRMIWHHHYKFLSKPTSKLINYVYNIVLYSSFYNASVT